MKLWIFYALLSAVFAALVAIFGKIGMAAADATTAAALRAVVMGVFLTIVTFLAGKWPLVLSWDQRTFLFIVLSGVAGALSWLFYFLALKYGPVVGVAALDRLSVIFVVLFSVILLGNRMTWPELLGVAFITVGAFLLIRF